MKTAAFAFRLLTVAALTLVLCASPLASRPASATPLVWRVTVGGATSGACGDLWSNSCDLQYALSLVPSGTGAEVWVAQGLYTPGASELDSFIIPAGVEVYGGFDGVDDVWADRDPAVKLTILSGDITYNDVDGVGTHIDVISDVSDIVPPNSDHVVTMAGSIGASTVLDGFTITAGHANGGGATDDHGGGLLCTTTESGTECSPTLTGLTFSGNYAAYCGGGLYAAAMWLGSGRGTVSPSISHTEFSGNEALQAGGAICFYTVGAGDNSTPSLTDVEFNSNVADSGGAIYNWGSNGESNPTLTGATFVGNVATEGGALYMGADSSTAGNSDVTITNAYFFDNHADSAGGAIFQASQGQHLQGGGSSLTLRNAVLAGNSSGGSGGALFMNTGVVGGTPGTGDWDDPRAFQHLQNVTMFGNSAASLGGAMFVGGDTGTQSDASVYNSILWGDDGTVQDELYLAGAGTASIGYSDIMGGCAGTGANCDAGGNTAQDPLFVDAGADNLRVLGTSPVIDAGDNYVLPSEIATDIAGNSRYLDHPGAPDVGAGLPGEPIVDMGAYEFAFSCPAGTVLYVDADAAGTGDGSSWTNAFPELAEALIEYQYCSGLEELWVAEGVYIPGTYDASDTFLIVPGMRVYGGFDGSEATRDERDVKANVAILSGDIDGDDDGGGPSAPGGVDGNYIAEDASEIVGENPYHVVTIDGADVALPTDTVLDGFTITGGLAVGVDNDEMGGGLYCSGRNGGICNPMLENLVFSGNYAAFGGGGLVNDGYGGESSPVINNVTFVGNAAGEIGTYDGMGGAIYNRGQGDGVDPGASSPSISNSTFLNNQAGLYGGAMHNDGSSGGSSSPVVANSTFQWNQCGHYGGAVLNYGYAAGKTRASYTNVTFFENSATNGGGNMAADGGDGGEAVVTITNSILWGGTAADGPQVDASNASVTFNYSVIQDAYNDLGGWELQPTTEGPGNTEENPLLDVPGDNGGGTWTMALMAGSSAIDAGDDAACAAAPVSGVDQRGISRPRGPHCDIGAYERIPPTGDFDYDAAADPAVFERATGNWFVVGSDTGILMPALNFGNDTSYIPAPGDYDGDAQADATVFEKATGNWFAVGSTAGFFTPALNFGNDTDYTPVEGDYDGDGKTDPAVFEKATGNWFAVGSTAGFITPALAFGNDASYIPVPGDYDGDGKTDAAVFEKATGHWFVMGSTAGVFSPALGFGNDTSYIPVPGDFDGDGKTDAAVFERNTGNWFVVGSNLGFFMPALNFGNEAGYIPQPADYDGDGSMDPAVFEKATGHWFVVGSTSGFFTPALGFGNDTYYIPVVARSQ